MDKSELKELYALKGEYQTQIEIYQAKLRNINDGLIKALSPQPQPGGNGKAADKNNKTAPAVVK